MRSCPQPGTPNGSGWVSLALGSALYGQKLLTENRGNDQLASPASGWYAAGIILLIIAWWGAYKNKSCLRLPGPAGPEHLFTGDKCGGTSTQVQGAKRPTSRRRPVCAARGGAGHKPV